jgi:hypothetical protein
MNVVKMLDHARAEKSKLIKLIDKIKIDDM